MSILVVDDSRVMRLIVRRELRLAGYHDVLEAESGAVAFDAISAGGIALVLSDWNRPDMNGLELLTKLRAEGNDVIFGFVTSESADDTRRRAIEAGADFVVTKPFTADVLRHEIDLVLGIESVADDRSDHGSPLTVQSELARLLGRPVRASDAAPPADDVARVIANYTIARGQKQLYCVVELPLAASLGCALALVPARQAADYGAADSLPEAIEANFFEVANILKKLAPSGVERCVLSGVFSLAPGRPIAGLRDANHWSTTLEVEIDGYPSGRLGFVGL